MWQIKLKKFYDFAAKTYRKAQCDIYVTSPKTTKISPNTIFKISFKYLKFIDFIAY